MAVFCPKKELPNTVCDLYQFYNSYQSKVVNQLGKGYKVYQRKIYFDANGEIFVDVCYHKENKKQPFTVTLSDSISLASLTQAIERNERHGFYLIDGNASLEGNQMVFSAVFSTVKYGNCDYRVVMPSSCMKEKELTVAKVFTSPPSFPPQATSLHNSLLCFGIN